MGILAIEDSILFDTRCFAGWLYHYRERIRNACSNEEISLDTYKLGILKMIRYSKAWADRFRFEGDILHAVSKEQILERGETAIQKASRLRSKRKRKS